MAAPTPVLDRTAKHDAGVRAVDASDGWPTFRPVPHVAMPDVDTALADALEALRLAGEALPADDAAVPDGAELDRVIGALLEKVSAVEAARKARDIEHGDPVANFVADLTLRGVADAVTSESPERIVEAMAQVRALPDGVVSDPVARRKVTAVVRQMNERLAELRADRVPPTSPMTRTRMARATLRQPRTRRTRARPAPVARDADAPPPRSARDRKKKWRGAK